MDNIIEKVASCLVKAGSTFREDQKEAYLAQGMNPFEAEMKAVKERR